MHRQRLGTIPMLALTAVIALLFGSVGTATASGLTKGAVKRIATKVVKNKASTLSVTHASTADSATVASSVGGFTAVQLGTTGYRYALPTQTSSTLRFYTFPGLPHGNYLVAYAYAADVAAAPDPPSVACSFSNFTGDLIAPSYSVAYSATAVRGSASAIITVAATFTFACSGSAFSMNPGYEDTVSFVPIDTELTGNATASRATTSSDRGEGSR